MAEMLRSHDWTGTSLGPVEAWPDELVMALNLALSAVQPMQILWGAEMVVLYNDAMKVFLVGKHPSAVGRPGREVWAEAWPAVSAQLESVLEEGKAVSISNVFLPLLRDGVLTDMYWNYSYSPIVGKDGQVLGILNISQDVTDANLAQQSKERLTEELAQVLGATSDAVVSVDRNWRFSYLNPRAAELYAAGRNLLGEKLWEVFPKAMYEGSAFVDAYTRAMTERVPGAFEAFYPAPLNLWVRVEVYPTRDGIVTFSRDVTAEKKSMEEMRRKDERLRVALTATTGIGTWDWEVTSDLVFVDEEFAQFYEVDPKAAAQGLPSADFVRDVHPDDLMGLSAAIASAMKTGAEYKHEYRLLRSDGTVRWVSSEGRCQLAPDGSPVRFVGVTIDLTAVRQANDTLRMNEQNLRIAADVARIGYTRLNPSTGEIDGATDVFKANFGRKPEDPFTYKDLLASIYPEDLPRVQAAVRTAIETDSEYQAEYRVAWPDETTHWISARGRLIHFTDGRPAEMTGVTVDVTERHQAQEALLQTEKLAAVGRLASSIAHEINNPLEAVTNLLYIARGSTELSEIKTMLNLADQELRRVSAIANQTLRFHKQSTKPQELSCSDLFETVLTMYEGRLRNSRIVVKKRKRSAQRVLIYEGDIRQVLNNLVGNAIDAMPTGGQLLVRGMEATDWRTGRRGLRLTVADTGTGIPKEVQARIFDAFFTTKGIGGTGLGLWISAEIMQRHGGFLRMRSSQADGHRGTVATLFLPFAGPVNRT